MFKFHLGVDSMANKKGDEKVEAANVKFQADTFETRGRANELSDKKRSKLEWIKYAAH